MIGRPLTIARSYAMIVDTELAFACLVFIAGFSKLQALGDIPIDGAADFGFVAIAAFTLGVGSA